MKTEFVKGRWYKAHDPRLIYQLCSESGNVLMGNIEVFNGIFNKVSDVRPSIFHRHTEVSPNEVLQSIKTGGLSPNQLKEIAEVFYVAGVTVNRKGGLSQFKISNPKFDFRMSGLSCENKHWINPDWTTVYDIDNDKWATIVKHPAYGDKDLSEHDSVKVGSGSLEQLQDLMAKECASVMAHHLSETNEEYQKLMKGALKMIEDAKQSDQPKRNNNAMSKDFTVIEYEHKGVTWVRDDQDSKFFNCPSQIGLRLLAEDLPKDFKDRTITKVRRESDGEIFCVGDLITDGISGGEIISIELNPNIFKLKIGRVLGEYATKAYKVEGGLVFEGELVVVYDIHNPEGIDVSFSKNLLTDPSKPRILKITYLKTPEKQTTEIMNREKALERLTSLENETKELRKIIEAPTPTERWKPKYGESYWCIDSVGSVTCTSWVDSSDDAKRYKSLNVYPTKEAAQKDADYYLTLKELRAFSDGLDGEFYIASVGDGVIRAYHMAPCPSARFLEPRFKTQQRAEEAIKHFGDRLNLIYL